MTSICGTKVSRGAGHDAELSIRIEELSSCSPVVKIITTTVSDQLVECKSMRDCFLMWDLAEVVVECRRPRLSVKSAK